MNRTIAIAILATACAPAETWTHLGNALEDARTTGPVMQLFDGNQDCHGADGWMVPAVNDSDDDAGRVYLVPVDNDRRAATAWLVEGDAAPGCFWFFTGGKSREIYQTSEGPAQVPIPYLSHRVRLR